MHPVGHCWLPDVGMAVYGCLTAVFLPMNGQCPCWQCACGHVSLVAVVSCMWLEDWLDVMLCAQRGYSVNMVSLWCECDVYIMQCHHSVDAVLTRYGCNVSMVWIQWNILDTV